MNRQQKHSKVWTIQSPAPPFCKTSNWTLRRIFSAFAQSFAQPSILACLCWWKSTGSSQCQSRRTRRSHFCWFYGKRSPGKIKVILSSKLEIPEELCLSKESFCPHEMCLLCILLVSKEYYSVLFHTAVVKILHSWDINFHLFLCSDLPTFKPFFWLVMWTLSFEI